jgi:hypothetical protein
MRGAAALVSLPLAAAVVLAAVGGDHSEGARPKAARPAPAAAVARGARPAKAAPPARHRPPADNSACFVCHANYEEESMAVVHAKAGTGCVDCHGPSLAHRNDEDNVTPPDVIYAAAKIDGACRKCHDQHDAPATKVIACWQQRSAGVKDPAQLVCTDCHGEHRLAVRTVRWDKTTRKLLDGDAATGAAAAGAAAAQSPTR